MAFTTIKKINMKNNEIIEEISSKVIYIYNTFNLINTMTKDILFIVDNIVLEVKTIDDTNEINEKLDIIQDILFILEKVIWNESYNFPKRLLFFVKEFDRIDDIEYRNFLVQKIKNGYYDNVK